MDVEIRKNSLTSDGAAVDKKRRQINNSEWTRGEKVENGKKGGEKELNRSLIKLRKKGDSLASILNPFHSQEELRKGAAESSYR